MSHKINHELILALQKCASECNHCTIACLEEQDVKMMAMCIRINMDCAAVCNLLADLLARGSQHGKHLLKECIEICNACAAECEKHGASMEHCKKCAEACRTCADACMKAA